MNGEALRRNYTISNAQGLHMRPITAFVQVAGEFQSEVWVSKDGGERINGKSVLKLMGLAAEKGTELTLEVSGLDASQAMTALMEVLDKISREEFSAERI